MVPSAVYKNSIVHSIAYFTVPVLIPGQQLEKPTHIDDIDLQEL